MHCLFYGLAVVLIIIIITYCFTPKTEKMGEYSMLEKQALKEAGKTDNTTEHLKNQERLKIREKLKSRSKMHNKEKLKNKEKFKSSIIKKENMEATTHTENDCEKFLTSRAEASAIYDFHDPYSVPHRQTLDGKDDKEWDPASMSLEQSVFDSHREFVQDAYVSTQGANSTNTVRDDTNEVNKRWGLRRVDYTSVLIGDDARVVPSEYQAQVEQPNANTFVL
jgi:hypothetical protein